MTGIEQEASALRAAICGCGNGEDSHPEGRNPADDEMVARIMKAGFRRPASPATRETVTEEMVETAAHAYWLASMTDIEGDLPSYDWDETEREQYMWAARIVLEAALTEEGDSRGLTGLFRGRRL